jgi:hypothetical protein
MVSVILQVLLNLLGLTDHLLAQIKQSASARLDLLLGLFPRWHAASISCCVTRRTLRCGCGIASGRDRSRLQAEVWRAGWCE